MKLLAQRLWRASPASLTQAIQRRVKRWSAKAGWYTIKSGPAAGAQLFLPNANEGGLREMVEGTFDRFLFEAAAGQEELKETTCWDIGAHIGYHALGFAAQGAQVVAFEPNQHNAARLRLHLEKNPTLAGRIRCVGAAISDRDGEMTFLQDGDIGRGSSGSHLVEGLPPLGNSAYANFERLLVPTMRIDTLIESRGERPPDILKVDVEGAEVLVLRGGAKFLSAHRPLLLMEVHHICLMLELVKLLSDWKYEIRLLDEAHATSSRCFIMAVPKS